MRETGSDWRIPLGAGAALLAALGVALRLGAEWDARLVVRPVDGQLLAGDASDDGGGTDGTFQRLRRADGERSAEYGFTNFNQDHMVISYRIADSAFERYNDSFGYRPADISALERRRDAEIQSSYKKLVAAHGTQAQVNAAAAAAESEYSAALNAYLESRGFVLEKGGVTRVDMPEVVRTNGPLLKPLAETFDRIATSRGYRSMDIIGAVLSFVQTALKYREPPDVVGGKHTGGILPPITTVVSGWGDCDTKTALAASLLSNWAQMRMVGVSVPGHYLMAVLQIPDQGDLYVEYQGLQYVLLEPAGPAWLPPGQVADTTSALLNGSDGYRIYPFF
ncbi:MAG: hypothetical protein KGM24_05160 [Elusimicrobia bacterium]|nr:hypothetical protein [Elusimicrobiota bacterium]